MDGLNRWNGTKQNVKPGNFWRTSESDMNEYHFMKMTFFHEPKVVRVKGIE